MAENSSRTVQELVEGGYEELPHRYIWNDNHNYGPTNLTLTSVAEIPEIDFKKLMSESELKKLKSALSSWGCFQIVNHGMKSSFLDQVRNISREFFHQPMIEKRKYAREADGFEGYGNDMVLFEDQSLDWTDRLYLLVSPEDQRKLQFWPQNPENFRNVLSIYMARLREIEEEILNAMARSLSLPEDAFSARFGDRRSMYARFNYYPPCSRPELVVGLKPHADGSGITILLQDEQVEGLQLLRGDEWFRVPLAPYSLFVNAGDQLEIMSNGIFKSPVHRALANSKQERITVAMFCAPDPAKEVGPIDELVDDEKNPRSYMNVTNYPETYFHYYQRGKRPIDAVRL